MLLFDSHAHYFDEWFDDAASGDSADQILHRVLSAYGGNVAGIVNVGTNVDSSLAALRQAARYEGMYAAVGIHPQDCQTLTDRSAEIARLRSLLGGDTADASAYRKQQKIVALGEIGLDYNERYEYDRQVQLRYLHDQLALAQELDVPVIIHDRDAHGDCFEAVLGYPKLRGVFHSYSGSADMARELTRRGWMISFSGVVTFKNARRVQEVAASVAPAHLLVETDCPYLTPHPHRGKRNDSGYLYHTVEMLSQLHGMSPENMAALTMQNAMRLFEITL